MSDLYSIRDENKTIIGLKFTSNYLYNLFNDPDENKTIIGLKYDPWGTENVSSIMMKIRL